MAFQDGNNPHKIRVGRRRACSDLPKIAADFRAYEPWMGQSSDQPSFIQLGRIVDVIVDGCKPFIGDTSDGA